MTQLSIGFISIERSFLRPSIELFWNSLIAYAKKKILFLEPCENGMLLILENLKNYMIQLKHFCNASDWSNDDLEAMQVRAERLLGFAIQIQAQYSNVNGTDDLEETVRVISDKVVQEISQETQSSSTVKRRLHDFGIKLSGTFSVISDEELDRDVELILVQFPNSGYTKMTGYLTSNGYNIQEYRVRDSMRRVDPEGVMLRTLQSRPVVRRKYKVAEPLSLEHHDGNHKLIA